MKVIYLSHSNNIQGAARALINIVDEIRAYGVTPIVIVPSDGNLSQKLSQIGVTTYINNCSQVVYPPTKKIKDFIVWPIRLFLTFIINGVAVVRLGKIVKKEKPDIIHSNSGIIRHGEIVARKYGIPHVWHIREYQTKDFGWTPIGGERKLIELFSRKNNHCIAITKGIYDYFLLSSKDTMIYDGVFTNNTKFPANRQSDYFLFVGSMSYGKGVLDAITAFNHVAAVNDKCKLILVGTGGIDINKVISASPFSNRIQYLGQRNDVYELMAGALALIMPSYYEGFGFVTVEAMLNKCLVIGRDSAGTKEQFDNGFNVVGNEIALRFLTMNQLIENMMKVLDDRNHLMIKKMKDDAYHVVKQLYSTDHHVRSIYTFYCSFLQS